MHPSVHCSTINNSQDIEATQMSIDTAMDEDVVYIHNGAFSSVQSQSCPTLCDPMNHSTPGLPVHHQLLESTQTHVH